MLHDPWEMAPLFWLKVQQWTANEDCGNVEEHSLLKGIATTQYQVIIAMRQYGFSIFRSAIFQRNSQI